jgi:arylsulfatase A-like enzyme
MNTPEARPRSSVMPEQSSRLLLIAAWFGLATGLGEVSLRAVQKFLLDQRIFASPHVIWMAPLADLFCFTVLGCILIFIARIWSRPISLGITTFIFAFLSFSGPLLWYPRLHLYAALLLAVGLATQTARVVTVHPQGFSALMRRTLGWAAVFGGRDQRHSPREGEHSSTTHAPSGVSRRQFLLSTGTTVGGLALGVYVWEELAERHSLAQSPPVPVNAPNVLLIVLDTVRAQNLSLYGYDRPTTPQLERLAKTGVVFERALSPAPWTLPSHASIFTGRFPHELSADWLTPLDSTAPTLAEAFRVHGYATAGFVANLLYCTYETGLNRGFVHYEDYPVTPGMIAHSSWLARTLAEKLKRMMGSQQKLVRKTAAELNEDFLRWLSYKDQRPFFVFLNYMDAHEPYLPAKPFDMKFASTRPRDPWVREDYKYSAEEIGELMAAYDGTIAYLDHHLGLLFDELERQRLLENTLVVITSDHGEQFGEHGLMGHGNSLYLPLLHVPLMILFPSHVPTGKRVREPVSLRDVPATVVDLIKLEGESHFPGTSLARYWGGTHDPGKPAAALLSEVSQSINLAEWLPSMKGDMKSLVMDGRHYIKNGDGREELYDFENDPAETRDLADSEEGRRALERFRRSLTTVLARHRMSN